MQSETTQSMIGQLNDCAATCSYCITACLGEDNVQMLANCIRLNIDCAEMCTVTANFLARNSPHAKHLLQECVEICNACSAACEKHAHMDHCRQCADACRKCAASCEDMVPA